MAKAKIFDPLEHWARPKNVRRRWSVKELCELTKGQLREVYGTFLGDGCPGYMQNVGKLTIVAAILGLQGMSQEERKQLAESPPSDGVRVLDF